MADRGSTSPHSQRRVRSEARRIYDQLEKGLDNWYGVLGMALIATPVGVWLWCWLGLEEVWYKALGWGVGALFVATPIIGGAINAVEGSKSRDAMRQFDLRFPDGTERREWAVALLSDFTPTTDAARDFLTTIAPARAHSFVGAVREPARDPAEGA